MKHILISLLPAVILLAVILALFTPCMNMVSESMNRICSVSSTELEEEKEEIDDY